MDRTLRLRTLHFGVALFLIFQWGSGCFLAYSFEAEPPAACKQASDCPGVGNGCGERVCDEGACSIRNPVGAGLSPFSEVPGDCQRSTCDGQGNLTIEVDDTDVPYDGNPCTNDICTNGTPVNVLAPLDAPCGTVPSVVCDGMGACRNCTQAADCGMDSVCSSWSCENGLCVHILIPPGTEVDNAILGDCRKNICNSFGEAQDTFSPDDAPSDGNSCTNDFCTLDGQAIHELAATGTPCADCRACAAGLCTACDSTTEDCYAGRCVPKPQPCTTASECATAHCIDGFCCDSECASPCLACNNARTGAPSGLCAPVVDGTDPDDDCNEPTVDICIGGSCRCHNGVQDSTETGVDCGGDCSVCTGKWSCNSCMPKMPQTCCQSGTCNTCTGMLSSCEALEGKSCVLGSPKQVFTLGIHPDLDCPFLYIACWSAECVCL